MSKKSKKAPKRAPAKKPFAAPSSERAARLPASGSAIERVYKQKTYRVEVLDKGFRFDGREWRSLTAIAKEITKAPAISGTASGRSARRSASRTATRLTSASTRWARGSMSSRSVTP